MSNIIYKVPIAYSQSYSSITVQTSSNYQITGITSGSLTLSGEYPNDINSILSMEYGGNNLYESPFIIYYGGVDTGTVIPNITTPDISASFTLNKVSGNTIFTTSSNSPYYFKNNDSINKYITIVYNTESLSNLQISIEKFLQIATSSQSQIQFITTSSAEVINLGLLITGSSDSSLLQINLDGDESKTIIIGKSTFPSGSNIQNGMYITSVTSSNESFGALNIFKIKNNSIQNTELRIDSINSCINPIILAPNSSVFGVNNKAMSTASFVEGIGNLTTGYAAHAAGVNTTASGYASFSTGIETDADGTGSFAMGSGSRTTGIASFAAGINNLASGIASVAVGFQTTASGLASLSAGTNTDAIGQGSVAFGDSTLAVGVSSFAIGQNTTANTQASFAAGIGTFTEAIGQTTVGQYNSKVGDIKNVFIIGGGLSDGTRHNLFRAVGGKNSDNGNAERQVIVDVTAVSPELDNVSFFVVSGSSKFRAVGNETIEFEGNTTFNNQITVNGGINTTALTASNIITNGSTNLRGGQTTIRGSGTTSATTAFRVENSSQIARLTILDNGTSAFNTNHLYISSSGRIGIGTSNPLQLLHLQSGRLLVNNPNSPDTFNDLNIGGINSSIWDNNESHRINFVYGTNGASLSQFQTIESNYNSSTQISKLRFRNFYNNGPQTSVIMTLESTGKLGINTDNPQTSLHISGASAILTLTPQHPLPTVNIPTGSFAVSASSPPRPYFWDGMNWNSIC